MSRTGGTISRKSKTNTRNVDRKSAAKRPRGTSKSAPLSRHGSRAKPAAKTGRHGIRTSARVVRTPSRSAKPVRKGTASKVMKPGVKKTMKRTTPDKPRAPASEKTKPAKMKESPKAKEPVKVKEKEPAKVKAVAPPPPPVAAAPLPSKETREPKVKTPKVVKAAVPPVELPPEEDGKVTARRKPREPHDHDPQAKPKGTRSRAPKIPGFDDELMQDYVMDEEPEEEEIQDEMALDPLELPLELLDPELVEVPRPSATPKPKQKVATANRRQQACANCGNTFNWLSVEQLCFNCLKKKLSQRKREDESYSGFTPEAEEEEDFS